MADLLSVAEVKMLADFEAGPCVSLYMKMHREPPQQDKNRIRLKNLLTDAERQLQDLGMRTPDAKVLLSPGLELIEHGRFWVEPGDGLAIFLNTDFERVYSLPLNFEETAVVNDRFFLKPLMPLFTGNGRFYVLALSQNEIRLLQGTRYTVDTVILPNVPEDMAEALMWDDPESQLQWHTSTAPQASSGIRPAVFHGHGVGQETDHKENILRYFQQVAAGVQKILAEEEAPLVLAGVDYLLPIYQEANEYRHLLDEGVTGNPEEWSNKELHQRALEVVQPYFEEAERQALARFEDRARTELAATGLQAVLPAAFYGRVDTLFVAEDRDVWGRFNGENGRVLQHDEAHPGDRELLNEATIYTVLNSGRVFTMEPARLPGDAPVAAIFRY